MNPIVSIIIPVYNVKNYLKRCLESIRVQTFANFEVLMIDDGSIDGSDEIIDVFAELDERFCALHYANSGVSVARNRGLQKAIGTYISFIDADDWVHPKFLERLVETIENECADMAVCGYERIYGDQIRSHVEKNEADKLLVTQFLTLLFRPDSEVQWYVWNKLFRSEYIKKYFDEEIHMGEDIDFVMDYILNINNVAMIRDRLYYYFQRSGSATRSNLEKLLDTMKVERKIYDTIQQSEYYQLSDRVFHWYFDGLMWIFCQTEKKSSAFISAKAIINKEIKLMLKCRDLDILHKLIYLYMYSRHSALGK